MMPVQDKALSVRLSGSKDRTKMSCSISPSRETSGLKFRFFGVHADLVDTVLQISPKCACEFADYSADSDAKSRVLCRNQGCYMCSIFFSPSNAECSPNTRQHRELGTSRSLIEATTILVFTYF